jgi:NAD(P)H dehydrogenase (quinone)
MKHLVVVAHPAEDSFTMALTRIYAAELERLGHTQHTVDLYRMGFNPILTDHELALSATAHRVEADVARAQDDIRAADVLCVVYPLWWLAMPAMMKGYIDRVFARGFAYELHNGSVYGLLSGKKAVLITLSGAPLPMLAKNGSWQALQVLQDSHVFRSTGFDVLEHLHFDEIASPLSPASAENHIARVRACARRHFAPCEAAMYATR